MRAALLVAVFVLVLAMVGAAPAWAGVPERNMLKLINDWRAERGLHQVRTQSGLQEAARYRTARLLATDTFGHGDLGKRLRRFYPSAGYSYWSVGEVIAWDGGLYRTARGVFKAWLRSPTHRDVIRMRRWRQVGIDNRWGEWRGMQVRMWVVDFGVRRR